MTDTSRRVALLVGTYARNGGTGVRLLMSDDGALQAGRTMCDVPDASHGLWSPDRTSLYFISELAAGRIHALQVRDGSFAELWTAPTNGSAPCHLALQRGGSELVAANYESGSVAFLTLDKSGGPAPSHVHQLAGSGQNADRQAGPHAHWVGCAPNTDRLYCVDLGSDKIWRFEPNAATPAAAYAAASGSGPRHLAFHPREPLALLVTELASTLTLLAVEGGWNLREITTCSTLPPGAGQSLAGHIVLNRAADRIYVTNRGHDSIAVFSLREGALQLLQHVPTGGASPRFMLLLETVQRLLVANEEGGTVRQFRVMDDGTLVTDATTDLPGAAFLIEAS